MKSFFWRFFWCILPCALAGWVTSDATWNYVKGESGGYKLGVDLVGGTILVYEIDLRKSMETAGAEGKSKDFAADTSVLAESLKKRIDPNDLYNIIIRPAGTEGRVEIILPTGGTHRTKKAEDRWRELLAEMGAKYLRSEKADAPLKLEVGRGKVQELADRLQSLQAKGLWEKKLFGTKESWQALMNEALQYWADLDDEKSGLKQKVLSTKVGDIDGFADFVLQALERTTAKTTPNAIQTWVKQRAWAEMIRLATKQKGWGVENAVESLNRIPPDNVEQLITLIQAKGNVIAQAGLAMLRPLVGTDPLDEAVKENDIREFILTHYGPSVHEIVRDINAENDKAGRTKDLSVEEVQRIKDLVSKVGSLEFRILANRFDDSAAIQEALELINDRARTDPELARELKEAREKGLPPPAPREEDPATGKSRPKIFDIQVANGQTMKVSYTWVELGPQKRKELDLDNAAKTDASRNNAWLAASLLRDKALQLPTRRGVTQGGDGKTALEGALFFSRKCEDRNLPEEERRAKDVEYFVLCRDPELDNKGVPTPRIDGKYLVNAYSSITDLNPAVHFVFDNKGADLFGMLTRKNVLERTGAQDTERRRHLAIILDGMVMSAPTINSEIRNQGQITGNFTQKEVDSLVNILRAGRLPATLKPQPVSESTIAATLGEDTIRMGVNAILVAFAAVLVFMIFYYRFAGVVACIALLANLLLTVGFMVFVKATFTLPGLAGLVLTLGMAVDANILIYERLREERERGASLLLAIRNGYDRALPTIIDTHLSSIFTAIVLYVVGNDQLKGFGVSLTVGLVISLFTSIFMTRTLFDYWQHKGWLKKLSMMQIFKRPDINFMGIRKQMFMLTLSLAVLGMALFIARLPNDLNIDFVGGTAYGGQLTKPLSIAEFRNLLDEDRQRKVLGDVKVQEVPGSEQRVYTVQYGNGPMRTISLANQIPGESEADRIKNLQNRVSYLPDTAVELLYPSVADLDDAKAQAESRSRHFTVRTTEKEADIVQMILDQVLRDDKGGEELLKKSFATLTPVQNREARVYFFQSAPGKDSPDPEKDREGFAKVAGSASPSFIKTLLTRELRRELSMTDYKAPLPFLVEVTGEGSSNPDGTYAIVKVATGDLKDAEAKAFGRALTSTVQAFQSRPQPDRLENFDSQLASDTRNRAFLAILASWGAILLYLWFRFGNWTFGLAAVICLIHDLFITLGAIAICHYFHGNILGRILGVEDFKVDLPSVAALLTLVGYSVNDTIVVFDRIREVRGKNPDLTPKIINDSINQTLSRTVLASLTTWLVVIVLYIWGGPGVKLFAFVMVFGVIVGTYSSIYIASPLLLFLGEGRRSESEAVAAGRVAEPARA